MIQLRDEHRRHAVDRRAPVRLDRTQRRFRVERFGRDDDRGAVGHAAEVAHHAAEAVIERHGMQIAIVGGISAAPRRRRTRCSGCCGAKASRPWESGRAGRVLDVDRIVELQQRFTVVRSEEGHRHPPRGTSPRPSSRAPRSHPEKSRTSETAASRRRAGPAALRQLGRQIEEHRKVVRLTEARAATRTHARLVQRVLELAQSIRRIDVYENGAGLRGGVLRDDPFSNIGAPDADPVSALDPEREERASSAVHLSEQFVRTCIDSPDGRDQRIASPNSRGGVVERAPIVSPRSGVADVPWTYWGQTPCLPHYRT